MHNYLGLNLYPLLSVSQYEKKTMKIFAYNRQKNPPRHRLLLAFPENWQHANSLC